LGDNTVAVGGDLVGLTIRLNRLTCGRGRKKTATITAATTTTLARWVHDAAGLKRALCLVPAFALSCASATETGTAASSITL
jgi:hypothetical protein